MVCGSGAMPSSILAKHCDRIDPRCLSRRKPSRHGTNRREDDGSAKEGRSILSFHAPYQRAYELRSPQAQYRAKGNAPDDHEANATHYEPNHAAWCGAERHSDPDLGTATAHCVRGQAVQSKTCQQQRKRAEESREQREYALLSHRGVYLLGERAELEDKIWIDLTNRLDDRSRQQRGRS